MFEKKCQSCYYYYYYIYIYIFKKKKHMFCTCLRKSVVIIIKKKMINHIGKGTCMLESLFKYHGELGLILQLQVQHCFYGLRSCPTEGFIYLSIHLYKYN